MDFDAVVDRYIREYRKPAWQEMQFFAASADLRHAISRAAACLTPEGKRHAHQRRIPRSVLHAAEARLQGLAETLARAENFTALHDLVDHAIGSLRGVGALMVYDIAHRLGAFLGQAPTQVYLHAGAKAGARNLGLRGDVLDTLALPPAFRRLSAAEIEDCLCIFKDDLRPAGGDMIMHKRAQSCVARPSRKPRCHVTPREQPHTPAPARPPANPTTR